MTVSIALTSSWDWSVNIVRVSQSNLHWETTTADLRHPQWNLDIRTIQQLLQKLHASCS